VGQTYTLKNMQYISLNNKPEYNSTAWSFAIADNTEITCDTMRHVSGFHCLRCPHFLHLRTSYFYNWCIFHSPSMQKQCLTFQVVNNVTFHHPHLRLRDTFSSIESGRMVFATIMGFKKPCAPGTPVEAIDSQGKTMKASANKSFWKCQQEAFLHSSAFLLHPYTSISRDSIFGHAPTFFTPLSR